MAEGFEDLDGTGDETTARNTAIQPDDISTYNPHTISHKLKQVPLIKGWIAALEARATQTLQNGGAIPGYKLVESRTIRKWKDDVQAETALRKQKLKVADIFKQSLISVTQAEKLIGKGHHLFDDLVISPKGRAIIAPESDRRPAYSESIASGFDNLDSASRPRKPTPSTRTRHQPHETKAA